MRCRLSPTNNSRSHGRLLYRIKFNVAKSDPIPSSGTVTISELTAWDVNLNVLNVLETDCDLEKELVHLSYCCHAEIQYEMSEYDAKYSTTHIERSYGTPALLLYHSNTALGT